MTPHTLDPTRGYVRGATDFISLDLDLYNGQSLPNAPGIPYYFNTPTGQQWNRPVSSIRWAASNVFNPQKGAISVGADILLTLRDLNGSTVLEDCPLFRLSEFIQFKGVPMRNLYWKPRRMDWRNSFIYTTRPIRGVVYLSAVYPPS